MSSRDSIPSQRVRFAPAPPRRHPRTRPTRRRNREPHRPRTQRTASWLDHEPNSIRRRAPSSEPNNIPRPDLVRHDGADHGFGFGVVRRPCRRWFRLRHVAFPRSPTVASTDVALTGGPAALQSSHAANGGPGSASCRRRLAPDGHQAAGPVQSRLSRARVSEQARPVVSATRSARCRARSRPASTPTRWQRRRLLPVRRPSPTSIRHRHTRG